MISTKAKTNDLITVPSPVENGVIRHRREFATYWRDKDESYWLARLMGEVGELAGTLVGDHPHPTDMELLQIAGICINWLEMRANRITP